MLVDAAAMYYRAFFGLPSSLRTPDGRPVNAVRGFLDVLATFISAYSPAALACCWDVSWRPVWRVQLMASYKADRANPDGTERMPPALAVQVPMLQEVLEAFGLPIVGAQDFEADDIVATLVAQTERSVDIVTGDRDLFQLVDDSRRVRVLYCAKGVADHEVVDAAWVQARYGVPPKAYVDFAVLRGDPSDGLPGVPGVGDKTAAALLERHRSIHGVLAAAATGEVTGRLGDALMDFIGFAGAARYVSTVRADVPLPPVELSLPPAPPDEAHLDWLCGSYGLGGSADRLKHALWG